MSRHSVEGSMTTIRTLAGAMLVCALAFLGVGCGGASGPDLGTVQGKVIMDGQPVSGALVTFYPEDGRPSMGTTDASGVYQLDYTSEQKGAVIGTHTVRITTGQASGEGNENKPQETIPPQYNVQSELKAEVKAGDNTHDFTLE